MTRVVDRTGHEWAHLAWAGSALQALRVPGAIVHGDISPHPVLGSVQTITDGAGKPLTVLTAIDWAHPTRIPAIEAPARLPAGAGGVILDVLARLARDAHVTALRYAGPYPTSALYHSLLRSFATTASEADFTADALDRAVRGATDELPFDFAPSPHERVSFARGHAEVREHLERAVIDGVTYASGVARLTGGRAEVWFGDAPYAHVADFADDGTLLAGPHALPVYSSSVLGATFPPPLVAALAELIAELVPPPLAPLVPAHLAARELRWADLGARAARATPEALLVHAALWDRLHVTGLARVALAIAEALAPVVAADMLAG